MNSLGNGIFRQSLKVPNILQGKTEVIMTHLATALVPLFFNRICILFNELTLWNIELTLIQENFLFDEDMARRRYFELIK